jgi:hypothetical protein
VGGGEILGLRGENAASTYDGMAGDNVLELPGGDPAPGETRSAVGAPEDSVTLVNVSASLEADADGDGFGDETQDQCPTNATTQGPCPTVAPPAGPTGQRAAAIKKCKKKFPGKAKAKKRKKCIKKAKKLPV